MAAFSFNNPFPLDSVFLPASPIKILGFSEEPNNNNNTTCFSQFYQPETLQEIPEDLSLVHEGICLEHSAKVAINNINEPSVTNKHSTDSSSVVEQVTQKLTPMDKKKGNTDGSCLRSVRSKKAREVKGKKQKISNVGMKYGEEKKTRGNKKEQKKVPEESPTGYIHVRARRGQATDRHSLAERVRREKISVRMKLLQSIVPGCHKVTGKALLLDEIINYVQSLQNQVEFLSMKLASVNPIFYDFEMDLDPVMVRPEPTAFSDTTINFSSANNYPLSDSSTSSLLFQQHGQLPNNLSPDNGQLLWDVDDHRPNFINHCGFSNNLSSLD